MRDGNWKLVAAAFLASQCLTLVGSSAVQMAIAWYVAVETSSGAWAAAMLVAGFVPQMAVSPFAGAWIDRRGFRKAAIIAADAVSAATALALAVFLATSFGDTAALVALAAASSVRSLCAGVQMPAVQSSVAILVPEEALLRYNGIVSAVQNVAQFAAVPLAALTLSFGGISSAMLLDVVTAAVAVGVLAVAVKLPRVEATSCALSQEKAGLFEDVREGARYARNERAVGFVLASYGAFIFLSVPSGFLVPLLMERAFDASYAMLAFAEGAGCFSMVVGGVVLAAFADRMKGVALPLGLITYGAGSMGVGLATGCPLFLVGLVVLSAAIPLVQAAVTAHLQSFVDPAMMGRVFGFMGSMYAGLMPLGSLLFGLLADGAPAWTLPTLCGAAVALLGVMFLPRMISSHRREAGCSK
ncbi:MFS transporter [Slackia piriformis]|uniref:MFS transporter n=1 Tax=Slackia piriformis TaxID=626934 RepID=UPI0026DAD8D9|nr:MFS transporter [Slackia piriformis]MDO5023468.1 MFS transporter [Slackia piriformis]